MSQQLVELVTNPTPQLSVHQWCAKGMRQLNRRNKLTSLPFWTPNDTYKVHQFRLVLLRGVVKGDLEVDDPVGVFLEYLPPPIDEGTAGQQAAGAGAAGRGSPPIGCEVTIRCLNRKSLESDDRSQDLCEQDTATITLEDRQVGFKELVPASALGSKDFTGEDGNQLLLQVTVRTGVATVALLNVAKTSSQLATSLWSTFSSFTSHVQTAVQRTLQDLSRDEDISNTATLVATAAAHGRELPWATAPAKWQGRVEKWQTLITDHMVEDDQTFLIGPKPGGLTSDEQVLLTQVGLSHRAIMAAEGLFDYDRDVHEGLLSCLALRKQRYRLVPLKLKDETFWHHYFWKVTAVGTCERDEQVTLLLAVLNAPLPLTPVAAKKSEQPAFFQGLFNAVADATGGRPVTADEAATAIKEALEAADLLAEYTAEATATATDSEASMAAAAAASLRAMLAKLERLVARRKASEEIGASLLQAVGVCQGRLREHHEQQSVASSSAPITATTTTAAAVAAVPIAVASTVSQPENEPHEEKVLPVKQESPERAPVVVAAAPAEESPKQDTAAVPDAATTLSPSAAEGSVDLSSPTTATAAAPSAAASPVQTPAPETTRQDFPGSASSPKATSAEEVPDPAASASPAAVGTSPVALPAPRVPPPATLVDDDFPTIEGLDTPSPKQPAAGRLPSTTASTDRASASALEFAPMPWEE